MDPGLQGGACLELLGGAPEIDPTRNDAARRDDPVVMRGESAIGHSAMKANVVRRDDEPARQDDGATAVSPTGSFGCRAAGRRLVGRRISPPRASSSRRMVPTTPRDESVDVPRVLGK